MSQNKVRKGVPEGVTGMHMLTGVGLIIAFLAILVVGCRGLHAEDDRPSAAQAGAERAGVRLLRPHQRRLPRAHRCRRQHGLGDELN